MEQLTSLYNKFTSSLYLKYISAAFGLWGIYKCLIYFYISRQHKLDLNDKTVVIIGASSGIGRAMAFEFYKKGARSILVARSVDKLELLCKELEQQQFNNLHKPTFYQLDITEFVNLEEEKCKNKILNLLTHSINGKSIDVLICSAGLSNRGSIDKTPTSIFRELMEVNFFGFIYIIKTLLNFIPNDGAIVSINSIQGRVALPYRAPYSCSKHASLAFFDSLRGEERPNLHILTVNAGYINTGFGSRALNVDGKPMGFEDHNQLRGLSPEEAAKRIISSLEKREKELLLAPLKIRLLVMLRWLSPTLTWWILTRKAQADKKLEEKEMAKAD
ncbi:hypothetical protein ACQ4LE_006878 [Meloidogyne hapla]